MFKNFFIDLGSFGGKRTQSYSGLVYLATKKSRWLHVKGKSVAHRISMVILRSLNDGDF